MDRNFFEKEVDRIASLSYMKLKDKEKSDMVQHFEKMYEFVSRLKEVDTEGIDMLIYPHGNMHVKLHEDFAVHGLDPLNVIKNAPDTFKEYVRTKSPIKEAKIKE